MYQIVAKEDVTPQIHLLEIHAPDVAKKAQAGQFVVIRLDEKGERIPLTIADWNRQKRTVTVVFMEVGKTTRKLANVKAGDSIANFVGPLGRPTRIEKSGTVVCVAGGFAIATIVPIARAMKQAGNRVISIMGFRTKAMMFWEDRLRRFSDQLIITTDDGSYGREGVVTVPLKELLEGTQKIDRVIAIGPTVMMKFSSITTLPFGVDTIVSLNPIMVDGTGMCGVCRVTVDGAVKFTCVDGPEFDGHKVDWDELMARQRTYLDEEKRSLEMWQQEQAGR
ncbi:MAG: sulfide/dihydroorotate dehydrogenase-like FAD/NAD-binding protein [Dehalococcoidia bacterium]|nr:MAG: sulfide/dihydroorotate dehydrogenase-like FAD/NAD-binding protein [Dehalococcoidia bacterium]